MALAQAAFVVLCDSNDDLFCVSAGVVEPVSANQDFINPRFAIDDVPLTVAVV